MSFASTEAILNAFMRLTADRGAIRSGYWQNRSYISRSDWRFLAGWHAREGFDRHRTESTVIIVTVISRTPFWVSICPFCGKFISFNRLHSFSALSLEPSIDSNQQVHSYEQYN
jgi:hypothetical protein